MAAVDLLHELCLSIRGSTLVQAEDEAERFELAFTYLDGSPVEIVSKNGQISDDGVTLHRLDSQDRYGDIKRWGDDFQTFLDLHHMQRVGHELVFRGERKRDLVFYIQGLLDIEKTMPRTREQSQDFDNIVRTSVKRKLKELVEGPTQILQQHELDYMVEPSYPLILPGDLDLSITVTADFMNRAQTELVIILSYADGTPNEREKHIKHRLADPHLLRQQADAPRCRAIIPAHGNYSAKDEAHIQLFTQQKPFPVTEDNAGNRVVELLMRPEQDPMTRRRLR